MELNRAFESTRAVLAKVQPDQLGEPTPCASWDVRGLINHFISTTGWWVATLAGQDADPEADYAAGDYLAAFEQRAQTAIAAFAADGVLTRTVQLPFGEFPGSVVLGMATLEQFAHGWDLAKAIGLDTDLDPELATEVLAQAKVTLLDAYRGPDPQAPFGPAREAPAGASAADRLAAFLGRAV